MAAPILTLDDSTSITVQGIRCWDETGPGGLREQLGRNPRAAWTLLCAWSDRLNLASALGGGYITSTDGSGDTVVSYAAPKPHPLYQFLWLTDADVEPIPLLGQQFADTVNGQPYTGYALARMRFVYSRLPFDPTVITNGELSIDRGVELVRPSNTTATLVYPDGSDVPAGDTPPIRIARAAIAVTRYNVRVIPSNWVNLVGCVNSAAWNGFAAETVAFDGMSSHKLITIGGADVWAIVLHFSFRGCGWNVVWNPDYSAFQRVVTKPPKVTVPVPINLLVPTGASYEAVSATVPITTPTGAPGGQPCYPLVDFNTFKVAI